MDAKPGQRRTVIRGRVRPVRGRRPGWCAGIVSVYLAWSLVFAGAVGISPLLHLLVEHGGRGVAHTHRGPAMRPMAGDSPESEGRRAGHGPRRAASGAAEGHAIRIDPRHSLGLPGLESARIRHGLQHWLEEFADFHSEPVNDRRGPGHDHDSLPQLLAGGLIEHAPEISVSSPGSIPCRFLVRGAPMASIESRWDLQSASRGPPPPKRV